LAIFALVLRDDHEIESTLCVLHLNERACHGRARRIADDASERADSVFVPMPNSSREPLQTIANAAKHDFSNAETPAGYVIGKPHRNGEYVALPITSLFSDFGPQSPQRNGPLGMGTENALPVKASHASAGESTVLVAR